MIEVDPLVVDTVIAALLGGLVLGIAYLWIGGDL